MKTILLSVLLLLSFKTSAQIAPGSFSISGSFSFASTGQEIDGEGFDPITGQPIDYSYKGKIRSFVFSPRVGYFISKSFAAGISTSLDRSKTASGQPGAGIVVNDQVVRSFGIGPFARYYFAVSDKFLVFADGTFRMNRNKSKTNVTYFDGWGGVTVVEMNTETKGRTWSLGGGITYLVGRAVGVEVVVAYEKTHYEEYDLEENGMNASIGLQLLLNNK